MTDLKMATLKDTAKGPFATERACDACGTIVETRLDQKMPYEHWGEVWFCDQCVRTLAADERRRLSQEIPLRGVPMS